MDLAFISPGLSVSKEEIGFSAVNVNLRGTGAGNG